MVVAPVLGATHETAGKWGRRLENRTSEPHRPPGDYREVTGRRLPTADEELLAALGGVVAGSDRFTFGIVTDTLSVIEQLDFGYQLIAVAGRIRTRAEASQRNVSLRTSDTP